MSRSTSFSEDDCCAALAQRQGIALLDEALEMVRQSRAFFYEAELHRLRGSLLLQANPKQNETQAEASFQQALEVARHQQARSLELRAAVGLGRLWQTLHQPEAARQLLGEITAWFSEGLDTADLREARTLLDELVIRD